MGHTFQLITRTLSLTRASSISGKFIHGLARKRLLFGCCCGVGWGFAWACCLTFFRSLRSFRFSDTASRSGVNSRVLSSIVNDNLAVQSRGPVDAWGVNERVRENRVETADLVFGCLRLAFRIPLPLTVTDADTETDTTCGAIGQGTPGFRNNVPAQACDELYSLPPSLGTPGAATAFTSTPALATPIRSRRVPDQPRFRYSLNDGHLSSVFFTPGSPKQVWKLRSRSHGKAWIGGHRPLEISEQRDRFDRRTSRL